MNKNKTFTSSINPRILATLSMFSKKYNTPKNKIIEMALSRYFNAVKRTELADTFKKAKHDSSVRTFAKLVSGGLTKATGRKK